MGIQQLVWERLFEASYFRQDGVLVLNVKDIPVPGDFVADRELCSTVVFPPHTRAGDHFHEKRREVFVGFGEGMELLVEDPDTKMVERFKMDPTHNQGMCRVFSITPGTPHAVANVGDKHGFLVELADVPQEKVEYQVSGKANEVA